MGDKTVYNNCVIKIFYSLLTTFTQVLTVLHKAVDLGSFRSLFAFPIHRFRSDTERRLRLLATETQKNTYHDHESIQCVFAPRSHSR